jgi:hypothetical protein
MTAIARAYASNEATPLDTLEFSHSSISTLYLVRAYEDLTATLEDSTEVTFLKSSISVQLPERSTDGQQSLNLQLDNISNDVYLQLSAVQDSMRTSDEKAIIKYRSYLESDLSAPSGGVIRLFMSSASINRIQASISAAWSPFPDARYPRYRYYPTLYPGVKYA